MNTGLNSNKNKTSNKEVTKLNIINNPANLIALSNIHKTLFLMVLGFMG